MFQPIRIIARALLVPAMLAVALSGQPAASAGALHTAHFVRPGSAAVAVGTPAVRWAHFKVRW